MRTSFSPFPTRCTPSRHAALFCLANVLLCGLLPALERPASAQGTRADYARADGLAARYRNTVFRDRVQPQWIRGAQAFWYQNRLADQHREYVLVTANPPKRQPAFDHARLATALSNASGKKAAADRLALEKLTFAADLQTLHFHYAGQHWSVTLADYKIRKTKPPGAASSKSQDGRRSQSRRRGRSRLARATSPDGRWTAFIKDHNVWLKNSQQVAVALSRNGTNDDPYVARYCWSPDSQKLVVVQEKKGDDRKVYLIESSPRDRLQPKLHSFHYLKPGDRIPHARPRLFNVKDLRNVPIAETLFPNPWRISDIRWDAESQRFTFKYNQRGHQVLRIVAVDGQTGEAGTLVNETSKTFIDYAYKQFAHYLDDTHELIWMSERDGWNHLYLWDQQSGQMKNQITTGPWVVRRVNHVDPQTRQIWFTASGIFPEQDPYYLHHCRIGFDGRELTILTRGNGTHQVQYSPDRKLLIDTYSRVDLPPITELRDGESGRRLVMLEQADTTRLKAAGWRPPERFQAKGRDGKTDIYGVLFRPTNYQADQKHKYPVIEKIYAGPHGSFAPKSFRPLYDHQTLAELGFVVVQLDGMGTSNRSKKFHDVCWKNLGDSGFPDRIAWIRAAAKKDPALDISRVGIYGGSAGGQSSTRALLAFGDFYKAAVSDCGCHDNRMDKIWWNELWMGWPLGPHYAEQSNVTQAHRLQGKLLLIVGELDRNVDPASTMQVVNALIKADKDFEMLVIPGGGHGIGGKYGIRRRRDFFVRHLLRVAPRSR